MNWRKHRGFWTYKSDCGTIVMYEPLSMKEIVYMMTLEEEEPDELLGELLKRKKELERKI